MAEPKWVLLKDLPKEVRDAARLKARGAKGRDPIGMAWENDSRIGVFGDIYHSWRTDKMEVCLTERHPDGSQYIYRPVYDWHEFGEKWDDADISWVRCWKKVVRVPVHFQADYCPACGERLLGQWPVQIPKPSGPEGKGGNDQ